MNRNMMRRIELAWPILDKELRQRVIDECLVAYLHDTNDVWQMKEDGHYYRTVNSNTIKLLSAQNELIKRYSGIYK